MSEFKKAVHRQYLQLIGDRIDVFRDMISGLTEGAASDAKGSAGDKHETALSMMHLEQEKLNVKLAECIVIKQVLDRIDPAVVHKAVALGSLVRANDHWLFVSAALPKITVQNVPVIALSPQSPLGALLMGKTTGSTFHVGTTEYTIQDIM
jgi:hypothetical protein